MGIIDLKEVRKNQELNKYFKDKGFEKAFTTIRGKRYLNTTYYEVIEKEAHLDLSICDVSGSLPVYFRRLMHMTLKSVMEIYQEKEDISIFGIYQIANNFLVKDYRNYYNGMGDFRLVFFLTELESWNIPEDIHNVFVEKFLKHFFSSINKRSLKMWYSLSRERRYFKSTLNQLRYLIAVSYIEYYMDKKEYSIGVDIINLEGIVMPKEYNNESIIETNLRIYIQLQLILCHLDIVSGHCNNKLVYYMRTCKDLFGTGEILTTDITSNEDRSYVCRYRKLLKSFLTSDKDLFREVYKLFSSNENLETLLKYRVNGDLRHICSDELYRSIVG